MSAGKAADGEPKRGLICTFYSFKGGVGRSMALANVAVLLARWGKKVLIVDFDLEAPGIENFFKGHTTVTADSVDGVVDLINGHADNTPLAWPECVLKINPPEAQEIHLIPAGRADTTYSDRLRRIKWDVLFEEKGLGTYLETLRNEWRGAYDFVLVDSRTGVTDIGGICTIHLPDILVTLFTATEQSLGGVKDVMLRARKGHASLPVDRNRLLIVPIPARDESNSEYKLAEIWRARFAADLADFFADWIPRDETPLRVLDRLRIPYLAYWSFGERLPVLEEDVDNPKTLAYSYQLIARLIFSRLNWSEAVNAKITDQHITPGPVYLSYAPDDRAEVERIAKVLEENGIDCWFGRRTSALQDWKVEIARNIGESTLFMPILSRSSLTSEPRFFREEWKLALKRQLTLPEDVPFIVPVVIDETTPNDPNIPDEIRRLQWITLRSAEETPNFIQDVIRRYRTVQSTLHQGKLAKGD